VSFFVTDILIAVPKRSM